MDETQPSEVTLYNWTDYLDPSIKKDFEKAKGVKVREVFFSSNEEMLAKMRAGAKGYDVIVPSDYMVTIMIEERSARAARPDVHPQLRRPSTRRSRTRPTTTPR